MAKEVFNNLVNYYHKNKLSHAYLIETDDLEKCFSELKQAIKQMFCENNYEDNCTKCNICNLIEQNYLPSFIVIEPDGQTIKKEQVAELKRLFSSIPIYTKDNIYVIKGAEKLNDSSANTMLKFLEEPEDHIIGFFLTNGINNVISTIKSRCEILYVNYNNNSINKLSKEMFNKYNDVIKKYLYKVEVEKNNLIMYNKDVLLGVYTEREDIKNIFKIILYIYEQLLNKKLGTQYNVLIDEYSFLDNNSISVIEDKIKLLIRILEDIQYNANIELLLDRFIIELSDFNE